MAWGQVSWLDSFSVKSKSAVFQESKSFFNMFTKYNIWFTESSSFSLSESQPDYVVLLGLQKHLYYRHRDRETETETQRGIFLNSKGIPKTYLFLYVSNF